MEGVVLVEMSSGALHYTKSFSEAFDVRHPKTERLNLAALIFALQNFADSSVHSTESNEALGAGLQTSGAAEIAMFATPLESMVLTTTPSRKLLVVLYTTPEFDANAAKCLARRVAFNYENCASAEVQLMTALNQVPRRFRHAFSQAVDDTAEQELIRVSERIFLQPEGESGDGLGTPTEGELFLFFYYSERLGDSGSDGGSGSEAEGGGTSANAVGLDDREEECCNAVRSTNPTLSEMSKSSAQNLSIRNMMASTRAIIATPVKRNIKKKKKYRKKTRWRARNAVMDHSEPHEFQRVVEIHRLERKAAAMEPQRTGRAHGIADVLLPFIEVSGLSLFTQDFATLANSNTLQQRPQKLDQLVWKNAPGAAANGREQIGTNMLAWRSGPCCIFYPITAVCMNPESKPRVRLAVSALFAVLESILKAKAKVVV